MKLPYRLLILFIAMLTFSHSAFAEIQVSAAFSPAVVSHGDSTRYIITIHGETGDLTGRLPKVDGLNISKNPSVSSSVQIINWQKQASITYTYTVRPLEKGTFSIPAWNASIDGEAIVVPPATLRVAEQSDEMKNALRLELSGLKDKIYVGETIDATLSMLVRSDLTLAGGGLPIKEGDAFSCSEFTDKYEKKEQRIEGVPYLALIWPIKLTPLKTGEQELQFQQQVALEIVNDRYLRRRRSMFDSMFDRMSDQKQVTLISDKYVIDVLDLPEVGKPAGFTGALGEFEVERFVDPDEVTVGEPVSITLEVKGAGNFSRISAPPLENTENWKIYPAKSNFVSLDDSGYKGTKSFEYVLIPQEESITKVPDLSFSYFDPNLNQYKKKLFDPEPIKVNPAPETPTAILSIRTPDSKKPKKIDLKKDGIELLPLRFIEKKKFSAICPLFCSKDFWLFQLIPLFVLLSIIGIKKRKNRFASDEGLARRHHASKGVRQKLKEAKDAANSRDAELFFEASRSTIQHSLIKNFPRGQNADSLTLVEIQSVLSEESVSEETRGFIEEIFTAADAIKFAKSAYDQVDLQAKRKQLEEVLGELN